MYVNEIFYSLQGEGLNVGRAAVFVRLSRCNLRCSFCDTEFEHGEQMSLEQITLALEKYPSKLIIWTGGEPTLQLTSDIVAHFKAMGYEQAIETNGTRAVPEGIDYITCSPKLEDLKLLHRNFPQGVSEFRFPVSSKSDLPPQIEELPSAEAYLVSPVFCGNLLEELDEKALALCLAFVQENPRWRLSIQLHKLIHID